MIIQIGDKDDFSSIESRELANEILQEWFKDFEERNPNLKVYNAVIHNDEASPHMHLNFVPVASDYKRGLEKQVAFDRAIKQQDNTLDKVRPFEDWREKEVQLLEKMLLERGIERKLVGTNEYKDVNEYKEKKDLEKEIRQLEKDLLSKKNELLAFNEQVPNEIKVPVKQQLRNVEVPTGEKTFFGNPITKTEKKPTGNVIISEDDFKKMMTAAKQNKKIKGALKNYLNTDLVQENQKLKEHIKDSMPIIEKLNNQNEQLKKENTKLFWENDLLKDQISHLKHDIRLIYESTKEFLKERTDGLKAFKNVFKGFVDKVKDKTTDSQVKRNVPLERNEFEKIHSKELNKEKDRGMER